jgi:aminoglycoside 6'-N-acetyltransferase I
MQLRTVAAGDIEAFTELRSRLWPTAPKAELREEAEALVAHKLSVNLPMTAFVAEEAGRLIGFVEVGLRSHADGCDPVRPVGFLEGWFVEPSQRERGVGRALVQRAEEWCVEQGCTELASDTWIDSDISQHAHAALGFEVVDRCVHFRKDLTR